MHKLSKLFHGQSNTKADNTQEPIGASVADFRSSAAADLFKYRRQRGVNLGSWFVLERWITDAPFRSAHGPAQSDLDVARGSNAKEILEHHWDNWITEGDWTWIAERGINAVRIPIGYYHLCGADASVLQGTDFADFGHVFQGAWNRITNAIATAHRFGLAVLIAPGKQNPDAHAGATGPAQFFNKQNMTHTIHVLSVLLTQLNAFGASHNPPLPNVVGIELLNEPQHNGSLERWYLDAIRSLRQIDPSIPLYIGDSWRTDQYASFIETHQSAIPFTVLDHHLYRCFTQGDASTSVSQHIQNLTNPNDGTPQMLARVSQKIQAAGGGLVVGEWSGALNPGSLHGVGNEVEMRKAYISAQLALYEEHCAGYYFWTYKKEHAGDKGWSFKDAVGAGVFPSRVGLGRNLVRDDPQRQMRRDQLCDHALGQHSGYWSQYSGHYEHWRFSEGFIQGWDDNWMFFNSVSTLPPTSPVPELGFKGPWMKRRIQEHIASKGNGNIWEYEHGFLQGLLAARKDLADMH
ncbi:hypothetical protein EW026_g2083 [Hermanssonia centrifuga]|uniref:Glycoside hydrolase family 5 domain-containing protein n=1 Tax=Hermanssonia centrifuga TaxID=98765 RepID=A0A4S4KPC9_9APHY|nr:hypothetical protein EW026_g2083 [Hermanssonia centrifuga]